MDAITLRKLPPRVAGAVRKRAEERQTSLNKAVIGLLEESVGEPSRPLAHHDLDALCGLWSRAESRAFDRSLREQRAVDPELWK